MANKKVPKIPKLLICEKCNYDTYNKKDFSKHLYTNKHLRLTIPNNLLNDMSQKSHINEKYRCICSKEYKHQSSLCKHKKICTEINKTDIVSTDEIKINNQDIVNIIVEQSKENKELKELLIEQNKLIMEIMKSHTSTNINNSNNINTTNNHFNINLFLNEKCKDAINLMDFVNQIKGNLKDLESFGLLGFVDGISKIFIRELKSMSVYKRPIHCTDVKREKMYVKDENKWEKEEDDKPKIKMAIKHITHNNIKILPEWQKENPLYSDSTSRDNDIHNKIIIELMSDEEKLYNKIITNLSKNVIIDKDNMLNH
jgi:hypothetical protein